MRVARRTAIKGAVAVAVTMASDVVAARQRVLIVYDSRIPASRAFARRNGGGGIDIAREDANLWNSLRSAPPGRVTGLTRWNDLVVVRGLLEAQGKRLKTEARQDGLFRWAMA